MLRAPDGLRAGRKIKVGGIGHYGEYCIVKYGRGNYWTYPAEYLFHAGRDVCHGDLVVCVSKVYTLSGNTALNVVIDNG